MNGTTLVQVTACRLFGAKPPPEPILIYCQLDSRKNFSEIRIKNGTFLFKKIHLKMSSVNMAAILSRVRWVKKVNKWMTLSHSHAIYHHQSSYVCFTLSTSPCVINSWWVIGVTISRSSGCTDGIRIPWQMSIVYDVNSHIPIRYCIITTTIAFIKHNAIPLCQSIEHIAEPHNAIYISQLMLTQHRSMIFILYIYM